MGRHLAGNRGWQEGAPRAAGSKRIDRDGRCQWSPGGTVRNVGPVDGMVEDGECFEEMNEYYVEIGQRVRQARGSRTQSDLARLAAWNRLAVANIELGR